VDSASSTKTSEEFFHLKMEEAYENIAKFEEEVRVLQTEVFYLYFHIIIVAEILIYFQCLYR
jgi:hypothetical protein